MTTNYNRATDEAIDYLGSISIYTLSGKNFDEVIDILKCEKGEFIKMYCNPSKPLNILGSANKEKMVFTRMFLELDQYSEGSSLNVMGVRPITPIESAKLNDIDEQNKNFRRKHYETLKKEFEQTNPKGD